MRRCSVCVLPENFPGITIDQDGVCSLCRDFTAGHPPAAPARLMDTLSSLLADAKATNHRYDAVVAFSGGKDRSYLLHLLASRFGLRLLAVTFDNGFVSATCFANMRNVVSALAVDHVVVRHRQDHMNAIFLESALSRVFPDHLTRFGSGVCIACIRIVITTMLRIAIEKNVPMVMLGNTPGQVLASDEELIFKDNVIPLPLRRQLFARLAERTGSWAYDYLVLSADEYQTRPFPWIVSPLPIVGYDEDEIYRVLAGLGWTKPVDVDPSSTNCRLNAFGIIRHKNLYRFHPYDYEMSRLVRLGVLTREAALDKLNDPANTVVDVASAVERDLMCRSCSRCGPGA
jgi:tRNA(Ile)-lysidine synthase TilS/MesJ